MPTNILLLGTSGIPGRYILNSLQKLSEEAYSNISITVVKRPTSTTDPKNQKDRQTVQLDDFSDTTALAKLLTKLNPSIVISALNAEPAPVLDNHVVDAILQHHQTTPKPKIFFVNGYTLDLLHPSATALLDDATLSPTARQDLEAKTAFARRLDELAGQGSLEYCTIVNAAFLDYALVKGYTNVNLESKVAALIDGGEKTLTGCSLAFVGDVVALVAEYYAFGSKAEKARVVNRRLRVAETVYSARSLMEAVEKVTGSKFETKEEESRAYLAAGKVVRYLNWSGGGPATFTEDGFEFGKEVLKRRSLEELCDMAIRNGVEVFQ